MAVGLNAPEKLIPVPGIRLAACSAGIYGEGRLDMVLIELEEGSQCSAVFTSNAFCAAPVSLARSHLKHNNIRYCLINAGNANAGTGSQGMADALASCTKVAELTGADVESVLPFSTGVIGEFLPMDAVSGSIPGLYSTLDKDGWLRSATAIMTTDTIPKGFSRRIDINGSPITITGIAKGSGMIKPDMATMLAFIATDACVEKELLSRILSEAVNKSFNRITVDGDTSTNDACVLMATGKSVSPQFTGFEDEDTRKLREAIIDLCFDLAQAIVRDAEGASKFVTIEVSEGMMEQECLDVAYTIAHSPLVKTALFASDPNWGRILAAIGRAGLSNFDISKISIYINELCIVAQGVRADNYSEEQAESAMSLDDILIKVILGRGGAEACIWTSDLSHEYVRINAEYRT